MFSPKLPTSQVLATNAALTRQRTVARPRAGVCRLHVNCESGNDAIGSNPESGASKLQARTRAGARDGPLPRLPCAYLRIRKANLDKPGAMPRLYPTFRASRAARPPSQQTIFFSWSRNLKDLHAKVPTWSRDSCRTVPPPFGDDPALAPGPRRDRFGIASFIE